MIRFYCTDLKDDDMVKYYKTSLIMDSGIWQSYRTLIKEQKIFSDYLIDFIPIRNGAGELIAYGYQDDEANRELRMIKELRSSRNALQFTDIYPEYKKVIILGCNELAVSFANYLAELGVNVSIMGKYCNYFGYRSSHDVDLDGKDQLIIYAEGMIPQNGEPMQTVMRSTSPEFEIIDKIYEENVRKGIVRDTIGDFKQLLQKLKGGDKQEIVILGDDHQAQDAYDLLIENGIDICCFAVPYKRIDRILGKKVLDIFDAIRFLHNPVFINCHDTCGALGDEWTEFFDYLGYERNRQYFLLKDYVKIPVSNLVHVMYDKKVLLAGDRRLCKLLSDYLYDIEKGEVTVEYIDLSEKLTIRDDDILCLVAADYKNRLQDVGEKSYNILQKSLTEAGFVNYTDYFVSNHSFALIDLYLNQGSPKYSLPELTPKGILMGRIPPWSGNVFFRGVLDGHPEIIMMSYSDLNENLFYYCIRLAHVKASELLTEFWRIYNAEAQSKDRCFQNPEKFEATIKRFLKLKSSFSSQELFVMFQIAYVEMTSGHTIADIGKQIIYWEPHFVSRSEFPFYALWLEDEKIEGQTIVLRRDNIVRVGSGCNNKADGGNSEHPFYRMFCDEYNGGQEDIPYHHWIEYKMRFEDIKVKPKEKLTEVCEKLGISWSDSLYKTTLYAGSRPFVYDGIVDFDLKAVFNKYEDFLSEFDRFRVSLASSPYQKRYGYSFSDCTKFSRREIQEWFLKPFRFDEKLLFGDHSDHMKLYKWVMWQMWEVRKQFSCKELLPEFEQFCLGQKDKTQKQEHYEELSENEIRNISKLMKYIKAADKLVLYGTGYACRVITKLMDDKIESRVTYCDRKASSQSYCFNGREVIPPGELLGRYKDYSILVTSGKFADNIKQEFQEMGINPSRVFYNIVVP